MMEQSGRHRRPAGLTMTGDERTAWADLPPEIAAAVERRLGSPVVDATSQPGGFSAGVAARVRLADGGRVFVKAANALAAPGVARFHRREIIVSSQLPPEAPVPRLLDVYDDGTWVALMFEEVDGVLPAQPWRPDDLDRVLDATTLLARVLTPTPVDPATLARPRLGGWQALAAEGAAERVGALSRWAAGNLDQLAELEAGAGPALAGTTLLHGDLYPFNVLLSPTGVYVVDWPHAWVGAAHCDVLTLLSTASLAGLDPQPYADRHPLTRDLDPDAIDAFLAVHSGFLLRLASMAGTDAGHSLVDAATALGLASLDWLRRRR
ncbi:aminoglycoside phosphotransferase family protein [Plantactinospora sp. KBS50]|uniref:aminoglycoside phosphotransferase family protein n=1 Tax=Plantactinospora sp. KBS50 TaxID=2024580 RepID=UPI000BAABD38|nr:aminoglycoside phosphotransferase family protein [Plantactinospora sp. KBS50]ASW55821.1 aminoglycoside phosphotransferase [Plantactinospora sp. KBS50]